MYRISPFPCSDTMAESFAELKSFAPFTCLFFFDTSRVIVSILYSLKVSSRMEFIHSGLGSGKDVFLDNDCSVPGVVGCDPPSLCGTSKVWLSKYVSYLYFNFGSLRSLLRLCQIQQKHMECTIKIIVRTPHQAMSTRIHQSFSHNVSALVTLPVERQT